MRLSSSCPKRFREAISAVLVKAAVQNKKPWQLAYPWAGRRLWYDPIGWEDIYRAHWRLYMEFRPAFWSWAFHAPLESTDSTTRFNLMSRACCARLRFISLCIETWGYYDFCKRLDDNDDQFWYGGIPVKGSSQVRTDSNEYAEDLAALHHTRKPRYKLIMDHALDPSSIDDFGYNNVRHLLESTGALDPTADLESRLSLRALAQIRRDMLSGTAVPAEWVGDINVDPWKALKESDVIKKQQERNTDEIMKGTYEFPRTTNLTFSELEAEDVSDNEDDGGIPTAIYIVDDDEDGPKKKKQKPQVIVVD